MILIQKNLYYVIMVIILKMQIPSHCFTSQTLLQANHHSLLFRGNQSSILYLEKITPLMGIWEKAKIAASSASSAVKIAHFFTAELLLNFVFGFVQLNLHTANQPNSKLVKQGLRFPKIKPPPLSPIEYFIRARMELDWFASFSFWENFSHFELTPVFSVQNSDSYLDF